MIRLRGVALLVGALTLFGTAAGAERPGGLDVEHYRVALAFPDRLDSMTADVTLTVRVQRDAKEIVLDFGGLEIDGVEIDARPARFTRERERLRITVPERASNPTPHVAASREAGPAGSAANRAGSHSAERLTQHLVRIRYRGVPKDGLILGVNKYGSPTAFADNWPNRLHHWVPSQDIPSDKATVEFIVEAPERVDVVANGELLEVASLKNGRKRWVWSEATPIPPYTMVVGATEFAIVRAGRHKGTDVVYYLFPEDRDHGEKEFGRAVEMLRYLDSLIGEFPYEKLAIVESSTRFGGMENASAIFMPEKPIDGNGTVEATVGHEIAHQWFGDSVTQHHWEELWLSEGFATYFGALCIGFLDGADAFRAAMERAKKRYLEKYEQNPSPIVDPSITDLMKLLNANNYQKGAWVLHMLRREIGDVAFFAAIRDYYSAHRNGTATTRQLEAIAERRSGRELTWFFDQWIFGPGYPVVEWSWSWSDPDKQLKLAISQKQEPVMQFVLDVAVTATDGSVSAHDVRITQRHHELTIPASVRPSSVVLDPNEWLLKVIPVR